MKLERKVWVHDDPESNYSRCPECEEPHRPERHRGGAEVCPHYLREEHGELDVVHVYRVETVREARVHERGDPSVGIPHADFRVELWVDLGCYGDGREVLEQFRAALAAAYETIAAGPVRVAFDFEEEA